MAPFAIAKATTFAHLDATTVRGPWMNWPNRGKVLSHWTWMELGSLFSDKTMVLQNGKITEGTSCHIMCIQMCIWDLKIFFGSKTWLTIFMAI